MKKFWSTIAMNVSGNFNFYQLFDILISLMNPSQYTRWTKIITKHYIHKLY
jgi:hypothetical protein